MNTLPVLPLIAVIVFFSTGTDAIKCWKCDPSTGTSSNNKKCSDVKTLDANADTKDCQKNTIGSSTADLYCKKTVMGSDVFLGCQTDGEKVSTSCYEGKKDESICFCNSEKCNPAAANAPALLLVAAFGILTIFFTY